MTQFNVSIHSRPVRRLTPQPTDRGRADCPSLKGEVTEKDFIGSAVLSTTLFPLKGEVSNHKGIFDEFLEEQLRDPVLKKEYDALEAEFSIMQALIDARKQSGLTQKQLAERTGIAQADISRLERGTGNPSLKTLHRLAEGMGMRLKIDFQMP